ncbi:hypothetical protein LCGC14_1621650 [marine sediment metagenome]|uniref:Uncharacterized protein n=1 Tax=marine sediment metagenome TaxID=412755 RepID=A0A0F9I5B6_9ZZZZ
MGVFLGTLTIPISTKPSNAIAIPRAIKRLIIVVPATLTGTVTAQVPDDITSSPTFVNLTRPSGSAAGDEDITLAASKAVPINHAAMFSIRVNSGSDEAAARSFALFGEEQY